MHKIVRLHQGDSQLKRINPNTPLTHIEKRENLGILLIFKKVYQMSIYRNHKLSLKSVSDQKY